MKDVMVFVQARMASARFPGKVLAPLAGRPVIEHVLWRIAQAVATDRIVVCTSRQIADDPLAVYVRDRGFRVYRGKVDDVVGRLQDCLVCYPCERFFRVCGDSPLLDPGLFERFLAVDGEPDLVTNTFPRTFPKGQSLELIRSGPFAALRSDLMVDSEREHPTSFYYDDSGFEIVNVENENPRGVDVAVDTIEDLRRIEAML